MPDEPGRVEPRYQQIAGYLRDLIASGALEMNDQLPGQKELMEKFGASMGTVVKALDELRREGLVRTLPGKGTFVVRKPGEPSGEFVTLMKRLDEQEADIRQLRKEVAEMRTERQAP